MKPLTFLALILLVAPVCAQPLADQRETNDSFGDALATGDFDGDGYDDLAVGTPDEDIGTIQNAGAVNVIYGSGKGLTSVGNQFWYQGLPGVADSPESGDQFGYTLATGDFNDDGYDDLAVGAFSEDIGSTQNAGAVNVIYGSGKGLTSVGSQFWYQSLPGVADSPEPGDHFGWSLATGDFDGDGDDDLAVGVPGEDISSWYDAGVVHIINGSPSGLTTVGNQYLSRWNTGPGWPSYYDRFGYALAAGRFGSDPFDDLAIGIPGYDATVAGRSINEAGGVLALHGSTSGLLRSDMIWNRASSGVQGTPEPHEWFGYVLATGDFKGNGRDGLAIGVRQADPAPSYYSYQGAVHVLYSYSTGLSTTGTQLFYPDDGVTNGFKTWNTFFGRAIAAGDYDGNGVDDLLVGVPGEAETSDLVVAGAVQLYYGDAGSGLTHEGNRSLRQGSTGIFDIHESGDYFGWSVASGYFDADGRADIAVGVPGEDYGVLDMGAVNIWSSSLNQFVYQGGSLRPASGEEDHALSTLESEPEGEAIEAVAGEAVPTAVTLAGAYPNPFSGHATIGFALPSPQRVRLGVYGVLGREVAVLVDGEAEAGRHEAVLDGSGLPSGVYLVRLVTEGRTETQRLTLVR